MKAPSPLTPVSPLSRMDQMTAAIAASGVFIKAIESHFQLSNELVKVKNAMKMLRLV
jgi:hypothetical protein